MVQPRVAMRDGEPWFPRHEDMEPAEWRALMRKIDAQRIVDAKLRSPRWMDVDELRAWVGQRASGAISALTNNIFSLAESPDALPHYLLERHGAKATGGVLCVAGAVRSHVSAEELRAWTEELKTSNIELQVLAADDGALAPTADEVAHREARLAACAAAIAEREAPLRRMQQAAREAQDARREQRAQQELEVQEARQEAERVRMQRREALWSRCLFDCEELRKPSKQPRWLHQTKVGPDSDLRLGDMVMLRCEQLGSRPQLGIISKLHTLTVGTDGIGPSVSVGRGCDLLLWRASDASWATRVRDVSVSRVELTPACCGRASCGLLRRAPWSLGVEQQEQLINACRALKGWKPRARAADEGASDAEGDSDAEGEGNPVWPDVCLAISDSESDDACDMDAAPDDAGVPPDPEELPQAQHEQIGAGGGSRRTEPELSLSEVKAANAFTFRDAASVPSLVPTGEIVRAAPFVRCPVERACDALEVALMYALAPVALMMRAAWAALVWLLDQLQPARQAIWAWSCLGRATFEEQGTSASTASLRALRRQRVARNANGRACKSRP